MATDGNVTSPLAELIAECARTWPLDLSLSLTKPSTPDEVALANLVERARSGIVSTLPYARLDKGRIHWVSFGGSSKVLTEYGEDLRSWLVGGYGSLGDLEFTQGGLKGRLARVIHSVSPDGYFSWTSDARSLSQTFSVLAQMHSLLSSMPEAQSTVAPSLHVLRFHFVSALRLGEWDVAESVIDEIDRWNLEQAHKTMQMRLRVLGESGSHAQLLEKVEKHHLWTLRHPTRVAEVILQAVLHEVVQPLESSATPSQVCEQVRPWYSKFVSLLPLVAPDEKFVRLFAYASCLDDDRPSALALLPHLTGPLASFIRSRFDVDVALGVIPANAPASTESISEVVFGEETGLNPGWTFWNTLQTLVRQGSGAAINRHLSELDARVIDDAEVLSHAPDALLELISDPAVDSKPASRNALQDVLTSLIDVSISVPGFPNLKHVDLYLSLAEALVYLRGASANEEDAHLLHGLLAAIANLSGSAAQRCTELLRGWWQIRPILPRLDWLIGVMESLAPLHPDPSSMVDLWSEAIALATRRGAMLSPSQYRTWQRVAGLLELDGDLYTSDLENLCASTESSLPDDPLALAGWRKIAIVSLQESAAREAARELEARTGAEIVLVNGLVQDSLTKAAQTADVILLVWAACSHAVYRAFDDHRARLAYVQGTGASSIVTAAEQWAEKQTSTAQKQL